VAVHRYNNVLGGFGPSGGGMHVYDLGEGSVNWLFGQSVIFVCILATVSGGEATSLFIDACRHLSCNLWFTAQISHFAFL
jgi:hypothetical protein